MHIHDLATYEPAAVKQLAGRHGKCVVDEVHELLRGRISRELAIEY